MNATNADTAQLPPMQDPLNWPEFLVISLAILIVTVLAIIAPRRRGRMMLVTDVLAE